MYTIIAGTNRDGSNSLLLAQYYQQLLLDNSIQANLFSLQELDMLHRNDDFIELEKKYLVDATKFIFILPEYNGAFPGIFKLMMDMSDVAKCWYDKKVMLTGLASGRAGNLRALDAMTNICHYLQMEVLPLKIPISAIEQELQNGVLVQEDTIASVKTQLTKFIDF